MRYLHQIISIYVIGWIFIKLLFRLCGDSICLPQRGDNMGYINVPPSGRYLDIYNSRREGLLAYYKRIYLLRYTS